VETYKGHLYHRVKERHQRVKDAKDDIMESWRQSVTRGKQRRRLGKRRATLILASYEKLKVYFVSVWIAIGKKAGGSEFVSLLHLTPKPKPSAVTNAYKLPHEDEPTPKYLLPGGLKKSFALAAGGAGPSAHW